MERHCWDSVPVESLNPLIGRQVLHCETMTMARIYLKKGACVPAHSHVNEQISTTLAGKLRFVIGGEEVILEAGESIVIPPNVPHLVDALEDSVALDVFSPAREDWIRGDDAYLRNAAGGTA
jgi:quercetin dioxygenase-like cupin family protein